MKKLLSYLVPLKGKVYKSEINGQLELNWYEGKLMLDSKNANYSYGALQRALAVGLHGIGNNEIKQSKKILILGMGAGCVIETLRKDFENDAEITAVEIDPVVVDIAKKYFALFYCSLTYTLKSTASFNGASETSVLASCVPRLSGNHALNSDFNSTPSSSYQTVLISSR